MLKFNDFDDKTKEKIRKKTIKIATEHSSSATTALLKFVSMFHAETGHLLNKGAWGMMEQILPPYRLPASDEFSEHYCFYGCFELQMHATAYHEPPFLHVLEELKVPENIRQQIKDYVADAEHKKIQLNECIQEKTFLEEKINAAEKAWNEDGTTNKRKTSVVQVLGLSNGKVKKRIDHKRAFFDYVTFIRKKGQSKTDAEKNVAEKHEFASPMAVRKSLQNTHGEILKKAREVSKAHGEAIAEHMKGLVISNR